MYLIKDGVKDGFIYSGRLIFKYFKFEYNLWTNHCHIGFDVGEDYTFSLAIPPISLYLSFGNGKDLNKEVKISIHGWTIWWAFWTSTMEWSSKTPKWRHGNFGIADFFLGKNKYNSKVIEERDVLIPMPEKSYPCHIKLCEDTWKRKRWFSATIKRIHADIPDGIPHQGKGENSYDCGEDGCFGMTCTARSIADGVGKIVGDVLHDRVRYGGWEDWNYKKTLTPSEK